MADQDISKNTPFEKTECKHIGAFTGVGQNLIPTGDGYLVVVSVVCQMCGVIFTNTHPLQGVKTSPIARGAPGIQL